MRTHIYHVACVCCVKKVPALCRFSFFCARAAASADTRARCDGVFMPRRLRQRKRDRVSRAARQVYAYASAQCALRAAVRAARRDR